MKILGVVVKHFFDQPPLSPYPTYGLYLNLRLFPEVLRTFNYITTYLFSIATFTSMNIVRAWVVLCPDHYYITYFPPLPGMEQLREKMATLSGSGKSTQCSDQETFW